MTQTDKSAEEAAISSRHTGPETGELVRAACAGNREAYDVIVDRYFGMVYSIGLARLDDRDLAQDLTQEVFLRAYLNLGQLNNPDHYSSWITSMARNLAIDWLRRGSAGSRVASMVPLSDASPELRNAPGEGVRERMEREEQEKAVREALSALRAEEREIVVMHFVENLTQEQIAKELRVHRSSISRALDRALKRMRTKLTPTLRSSMSHLRAGKNGKVRTIALITAAASLDTTQKSALAAAASAGVESAQAKATLSAGASGIAYLFDTVRALWAGIAGASALAKVIAVSGSIALVAAGTLSLWRQSADLKGSSGFRLFDSWNALAKAYLEEHPENLGLARFVEAINALPKTVVTDNDFRPMNAVIENGWAGAPQGLQVTLAANSKVIDAMLEAAAYTPFTLPPNLDGVNPVPELAQWMIAERLILVSARKAQAEGNLADATRRTMAVLNLSEALINTPGPLQLRGHGNRGEALACGVLAALLRDQRVARDTALDILKSLKRVEANRRDTAESLRDETSQAISLVRLYNTNATVRKVYQQFAGEDTTNISSKMISEIDKINDLPAFETEARHVTKIWSDWVSSSEFHSVAAIPQINPPLSVLIGSNSVLESGVVRDKVALASIRLCETLAALRTMQPDQAAIIHDPFIVGPLRIQHDRVYSVGPDKEDQNGDILYDPTNGTVSRGDIVFRR